MTRWRARTQSDVLEAAAVLQIVAEMHIVGRPTHMVVGDAFTLVRADDSKDAGTIVGVPAGHAVVRMDSGRTFHLRPRRGADPESGFPPPRGRPSSDWVVERMS